MPMMASASPHRLLSLYEMVESILENLSSDDIVICAAICTYWREVVATSGPIRRALLYQPFPRNMPRNMDPQASWSFPTNLSHGKFLTVRRKGDEVHLWVPQSPREKAFSLYELRKTVEFDATPRRGTWTVQWRQRESGRLVYTVRFNWHFSRAGDLWDYLLSFYSPVTGKPRTWCG